MKQIQRFVFRAFALASMAITVTSTRAQSGGYSVVERGPDYDVLQKVTLENGTNRIHRIVTLATGLNFTNGSGQLVPSSEQISLLPSGGAEAVQGRHKVRFPSDIYNGVLQVTTPDGRVLSSRPLAVSYDDGSNTVVIATLTNAIGWLTASNQVTYRNCLSGDIRGDIVTTYRRSGFECDLVIRSRPADPSAYNLNPDFTTIQLVSEFFDTQEPQQILGASDEGFGLQDTTLKFGQMTMHQGNAFAFNPTNSPTSTQNSQPPAVPVFKSWLHLQNRTFLIEQVPLADLAGALNALPLTARNTKPETGNPKLASRLTDHGPRLMSLLPAHEFLGDTNQINLAAVDLRKEPGVLLDYTLVLSQSTPFTFEAGTTYYVSNNPVYFDDSVTFSGTAVIKFERASPGLYCYGPIQCNTSPGSQAILTAVDDSSVGLPIGNGSPSGLYGYNYLVNHGNPVNLQFLQFHYAGTAVQLYNGSSNEIFHCQFQNNGCDLYLLQNTLVGNCLFEQTHTLNLSGSSAINVNVVNCTFHDTPRLACTFNILGITNSLLIGVTNWGAAFASVNNITNLNDAGIFKTAALADAYLVADSPYRNLGTTNIDPDLLAELQTMTTYAPQDGGYPDNDGMPDLGYHYPINEDSDHDGLPDWWEWKYFGTYAYSGNDLDTDGSHTLLYDYTNGLDPRDIRTGLVGWWKLDELSGYTAHDSSPNGNNGVQATGTVQWQNPGLLFRAADEDSVNFADGAGNVPASLQVQTFTFTAWVIATSNSLPQGLLGGSGRITGHMNGTPEFRIDPDNTLELLKQGDASMGYSTLPITLSNLCLLACTYNSASGAINFYQNGTNIGTATSSPIQTFAYTNPVFGLGWGWGREIFNGFMEDVRLYGVALTPGQVGILYSNGPAVAPIPPPPYNTNLIPALSVSWFDISNAVAEAVVSNYAGVQIPAGITNWISTLTIPNALSAVSLQGAGVGTTILQYAIPGRTQPLLTFAGTNSFVLSGITFIDTTNNDGDTNTYGASCGIVQVQDGNKAFVIHDCEFTNLCGIGVRFNGDPWGVIYNCKFSAPYAHGADGWDIIGVTNTWSSSPPWGTTNAVYCENCAFNFAYPNNGAIETYNGARYVFRYNAVTNTWIDMHGCDGGGYRSTYTAEIYNNTFYSRLPNISNFLPGVRGGSVVVFSNTQATSGGTLSSAGNCTLQYFRCWYHTHYTNSVIEPWGDVTGTNPVDGNLDSTGHPALDQPGWSGPTTFTATNSSQVLTPCYSWSNTYAGALVDGFNVVNYDTNAYGTALETTLIQTNREYYNHTRKPDYSPLAYPHPLVH